VFPPPRSLAVRSGLLADVLSEGGLLELLLGELRRRAKILRKAGVVSAPPTGQSPLDQGSVFCFMNVLMLYLPFKVIILKMFL